MAVGADSAALLEYRLTGHYTGAQKQTIPAYTYPGNHGITTKYTLVDPAQWSDDPSKMERPLIQYDLNGAGPHLAHRLVKVGDLVRIPRSYFNEPNLTGLQGWIAEGIERRVFRYFLDTVRQEESEQPLLENAWEEHKDNHTVDFGNGYELKIKEFPNVVLLRSRGPHREPECIGEFDGFFKYRNRETGRLHIFVAESKVHSVNTYTKQQQRQRERFKGEVLTGLRRIYQDDATISYAHFATAGRISTRLAGKDYLAPVPASIREGLEPLGVPTLFFAFNETKKDFRAMARHIADHAGDLDEFKSYTARASGREIMLLDETKNVKTILVAVGKGVWREVPTTPDGLIE